MYFCFSRQLIGIPYVPHTLSTFLDFSSISYDSLSTLFFISRSSFLAFLFLVTSLTKAGTYIAAPAAMTPTPAVIKVSSNVTPISTIGVPAANSNPPILSLSVFSFISCFSFSVFEAAKNSFLACFNLFSSSIAFSIFSTGLWEANIALSCRYWSFSYGVSLNSASFSLLNSNSSSIKLVFLIAIVVRFGTCNLSGIRGLFSIFLNFLC